MQLKPQYEQKPMFYLQVCVRTKHVNIVFYLIQKKNNFVSISHCLRILRNGNKH